MIGIILLACVALASSMQMNHGNSLMGVYMNQGPKAAFDLLDQNKDGGISLTEFEGYYDRISHHDLAIDLDDFVQYTKMPHAMAAAEFVELDTDKDGSLTRSDMVTLYHSFDENKDDKVTQKEFTDVYGALMTKVHHGLVG